MMHFDFDYFLNGFVQADSEERLCGAMEEFTIALGFERWAMGHHVDLMRPPTGAFRGTNYPVDWIDIVLANGYYRDDPVHVASDRMFQGFLWSDLGRIIRLSAQHRHILRYAQGFGLVDGYTVPVHLPGEFSGTCSFSARSLDKLRRHALPLAQMGTIWAFESARRIMRRRDGIVFSPSSLTARQSERLLLACRGLTNEEAGLAMGISTHTANDHFKAARESLGRPPRLYLSALALYHGMFTYADILKR